jgi:hypothetical protein
MEYLRTPDRTLAPHGDPIPQFALERAQTPEEQDAIRRENLAKLSTQGVVQIDF